MRRALKTIAIILIGLVCGAGLVLAYNAVIQPRMAVNETPGAAPAAPGPFFNDPVAAPERLIIPKLGVDAYIKPVGVDANGNMATPGNATDTSWYRHGPRPGMPGSAVISGHLNTRYVKEAVFYDLDELAPDDEVRVRTEDGQELVFKVKEVRKYPYDAPSEEIFVSDDGISRLNLISCTGDWVPGKNTYNERLVVFAERLE